MKGITLIGGAILLWSVASGIVAKQFSVPALMWYPAAALLGAVCIAFWLFGQRKAARLRVRGVKVCWLLGVAGLGMALNNAFFMSALQITTVAVALLTHYLMPLFVALLFAPWLLGERPSRRDTLITLVGLLGLAVILWPDIYNAHFDVGALLGALSAVFFALAIVIARQLNEAGVDGEVVAFYQNFVPALLMGPLIFWYMGHGLEFAPSDWLAIAYLGLGAMGVGFILFFVGLRYVHKASHASMMSYGEPIGAILLAALFLKEPITIHVLIGGVLIVGAGIALVRAEKTA